MVEANEEIETKSVSEGIPFAIPKSPGVVDEERDSDPRPSAGLSSSIDLDNLPTADPHPTASHMSLTSDTTFDPQCLLHTHGLNLLVSETEAVCGAPSMVNFLMEGTLQPQMPSHHKHAAAPWESPATRGLCGPRRIL